MSMIYVAVALAAASAASNMKAQSKISGVQDDALTMFRQQMDDLRSKSRAAAEDTQKLYADAPGAMKKEKSLIEKRLSDVVDKPIATAASVAPVVDNTSARVVKESSRQAGQERVLTDTLGKELATLMGFESGMGDVQRKTMRNAGDIRNIGSFARGYDNAYRVALQTAPSAGAGYQGLGDLLGLSSALVLMGGLSAPGGTDQLGVLGDINPYPEGVT